jgi:hypothetical protein
MIHFFSGYHTLIAPKTGAQLVSIQCQWSSTKEVVTFSCSVASFMLQADLQSKNY